MENRYQTFIDAINQKKKVQITCITDEKGRITRRCVPFDYGSSKKYKDKSDRFHFYDLDSPDGSHNLSILPGQLEEIIILNESFEPAEFVKWTPNWIVPRDWGSYS